MTIRFGCAALAVFVAACFNLDRPPADKRRFLLDAARAGARPAPAAGPADSHLTVAAFRVQAPWAANGFVHRLRGGELRADFTHEFFVPAGVMLAEITRRWLVDAGLFTSARPEGSRAPATHWLEADVLELSVDARDPAARAAVLEIEFVLLDDARRAVQRARHAHRAPLRDDAPETIVAGWNTCLAAVLTALEASLR
jgi:hypothetical protein